MELIRGDDGSIRLRLAPTDFEKSYTVTDGGDGTYEPGSGKDLELTVKSNIGDEYTFANFTGLFMDGTEVDAANYSASAGSLKLRVKSEYLDTLPSGDHVLEVRFGDGSVRLPLKIAARPAAPGTQPDTGVGSFMALYMMLACFAALAAFSAVTERKRLAKRGGDARQKGMI